MEFIMYVVLGLVCTGVLTMIIMDRVNEVDRHDLWEASEE